MRLASRPVTIDAELQLPLSVTPRDEASVVVQVAREPRFALYPTRQGAFISWSERNGTDLRRCRPATAPCAPGSHCPHLAVLPQVRGFRAVASLLARSYVADPADRGAWSTEDADTASRVYVRLLAPSLWVVSHTAHHDRRLRSACLVSELGCFEHGACCYGALLAADPTFASGHGMLTDTPLHELAPRLRMGLPLVIRFYPRVFIGPTQIDGHTLALHYADGRFRHSLVTIEADARCLRCADASACTHQQLCEVARRLAALP